MDKAQKLEYQQQLDAYMERHQVNDLFQELLQSLLKTKPEEPLDFLIERLQKSQVKRVFVVGPPGCGKSRVAQELGHEFGCAVVSMGKVFEKEIAKRSLHGEKVELAKASSCPVDNETAVELLVKKLEKHEKKGKNSIVTGFPINVVQALVLQNKGIVPTRLFILNASFEVSHEKALKKLQEASAEGDLEEIAKKLVTAYSMYFCLFDPLGT